MEEKQKLNPHFVSGLVDGEGCFTYSRQSNGSVQPIFAIALNKDDMPLLEKVKDFFGVGVLYCTKRNELSVSLDGGKIYESGLKVTYRICAMWQLRHIVYHFEDYPLIGKKKKAFDIWREMIFLKDLNFIDDREKLRDLAKELSIANGNKKRRKPRKWQRPKFNETNPLR